MKDVLIKIKDKGVLMQLKQFGEIKPVSQVFNIYSLKLSDRQIKQVKNIPGVIDIEQDEVFEVQTKIHQTEKNIQYV